MSGEVAEAVIWDGDEDQGLRPEALQHREGSRAGPPRRREWAAGGEPRGTRPRAKGRVFPRGESGQLCRTPQPVKQDDA